MNHSQLGSAIVVVFGIALAMGIARGADAPFPNSDGSGDLSSAAAWNGQLPASTDRIVFTDSLTATATSDLSAGGFYMKKAGASVTLDMRDEASGGTPSAPRTITLSGHTTLGAARNQTLWFKGGSWDFGDKILRLFTGGEWGNCSGSRICVTDGARLYNLKSLMGSYRYPIEIYVAGPDTVVTTLQFAVCYSVGNGSVANIADGAQVVVTGNANGALYVDDNMDDEGYGNCGIVVSNGASLVKIANGGTLYVGMRRSSNYLKVLAGSTASLPGSLYFGHNDHLALGIQANDNLMLVQGAGSTLQLGGGYQGRGGATGNSNNVVRVVDGAALTAQVFYMQGHDNGFVVSNATVTLTDCGITCADECTNAFVRLQGSEPSFTIAAGGTGHYTLKNSFAFVFDLPEDGYAAGTAPVKLLKWGESDGTTQIRFNGLDGMVRRMRADGIPRRTFTVLTSSHGDLFAPADVERWNASLPECASLSWAARNLDLTVKAQSGTVLSIR